jgi:hypothetical protein
MQPIMHYKIFPTDGDFAAWQAKEKRYISQISPVSVTVDMQGTDGQPAIQGQITLGVFVTYWNRDPDRKPEQP